MKKLFLLLMLIVSTTVFSQTVSLEVKAYKFAKGEQMLGDMIWLPTNGSITIYGDFVSIIVGDNVNDVLTATSEVYESTIEGVKVLTFEALSQYDTEPIHVSFLENKIMMIVFKDESVIAIKYEYINN